MNPSRFADRIFEGGTLLTMNEHQPTAEALALLDGHILAVGTRAEILALRGPETEVIPLQGGTVIPAVVDKLSNNNSNAEEEEPDPQGTLAAGQRANFVVLSGNPLIVTPRAREELRVLHVVKDGRSLYFADTPPEREKKKDEDPFSEALFLDESGWIV